jgi:CheY-like chemotaxis protein
MAETQARKRVLVVDFDKGVAKTLALVFEADGYEVRTEHTAEAALATTTEWQPDLAVIEIILFHMNGLECANALRRRYHDCRIILLYASAAPWILEEAQGRGYETFEKPVNPESLLTAVAKLLNEKLDSDSPLE